MNLNPSFKKLLVNNWYLLGTLVLSLIGFIDSTYLSLAYFKGENLNCAFLSGCEQVTTSAYSTILGVPLALIGLGFYLLVFVFLIGYWDFKKQFLLKIVYGLSIIAFGMSLWLTAVQIFILQALCQYCLISAITSTGIFLLSFFYQRQLKSVLKDL
ncbi:hypothetical protein BK005_00150 [bacterium CG10_37_50]|nr:MAG: hypothetical protein BK005_00150 [bacterium CG10_37_50]